MYLCYVYICAIHMSVLLIYLYICATYISVYLSYLYVCISVLFIYLWLIDEQTHRHKQTIMKH